MTDPNQPRPDPVTFHDLFERELAEYGHIFGRSPNIPPPPSLPIGVSARELLTILRPYTLREIYEAYEPTDTQNAGWVNRTGLYWLISENQNTARWRWQHSRCRNDHTYNNLEVPPMLHGAMNKDDPENPTLSYGVLSDYSCYQAEELAASFVPSSDRPGFGYPDGDGYFPVESIRQLRELLRTAPPEYNLHDLPAKIEEGLFHVDETMVAIRKLRREMDAFSDETQSALRLFFVWVFIYTLYLRFWRGPGYGWTENIQQDDDSCSVATRDYNAMLNYELGEEVQRYFDEETLQWISAVPMFLYQMDSPKPELLLYEGHRLIPYLQRVGRGMLCMGIAGSVLIQTAYVYLHFLEGLSDAEIVATIGEYLPVLYDLEEQIILPQIEELRAEIRAHPNAANLQARLQFLQERIAIVTGPIPALPPLNPKLLHGNVHTESEFR